MATITDYIGGKHEVSRKAAIERRKGENEALLETQRFRKVYPRGEVQMRLLAFVEPPNVPTKLEACTRWPRARFIAGRTEMGGMFFMIQGEGETAEEAVDNAIAKVKGTK